MSVRSFVDTNILVYAHDRGAGDRHKAAKALVGRLWRERTGVLSTQVIQEFYVNVRRKALNPVEPAEARRLVEDYLRWEVVVNDGGTILGALDLADRFCVSFWDALILQAAKTAEAATLFSEDLSHGHSYDQVRVLNPFVAEDRRASE
ncbi:MAG: PIN domain-containing protein [bacterium]|nr:PIN domain-containing protein [bacterium]